MKIKTNFLREFVSITLGVLIALAINNWKDNYQDKKYVKKSIEIIKKDIKSNIVEIEDAIRNNSNTIDSLQNYINDQNVTLLEIIKKASVRSADIRTSSFRLLDKKLELADYELFLNLSLIEESKEFRKIKIERIFEQVYENSLKSDEESKMIVLLGLYDLISSDKDILEYHKNITEN